jgi:formate hydrogenlyase transcriptional activator
VGNDTEILATSTLEARCQTLVRVSRAIGAHHDPKDLFNVLVQELHRIVPFDYVGVSLGDKTHLSFQNYCVDMASRSAVIPEETLTLEDPFTQAVYERQTPLQRSTDEMEERYSQLQTQLKRLDIRSICALPLTTVHRKLGIISFGSKQVDAYTRDEIGFVSQVANQIALAFDDALNFTALRRASEELQSKNDRLQLLLEVTNQLVSKLELLDLLRTLAGSVRRVLHCDLVGVALAGANGTELRMQGLDFPEGKGILREEMTIPWQSETGAVYRTGKPRLLQGNYQPINADVEKFRSLEGIKCSCLLPLIARERVLGVLAVSRKTDTPFSEDEVNVLAQVASQIALAVENAFAYREIRELKEQLSEEKLYLEDEIRTEMNFAQIIGNSASLRKVLKQVETVAPTDSTVLICGETGTGKELVARAIHDLSPRRSKPFVKLNCAAIPTGLLESELFGHEKGAFTGAIAQRIGRFEVANGGTIFLDEIGEIPLELQTKLLRVLQEREFERLGSSRTLHTDARLIAATNRDLETMVSEQKFRSDLFFRLNVFPIHVPSLRERQGDIQLLVRHFAQQFSRRMNKVIDTIPSTSMDALSQYPWPGNIRELQNVIERAVIISTGPTLNLDVADLKFPKNGPVKERITAATNSKTNGALRTVLEETERHQILQALKQCNWIVAGLNGAAARLDMKRSTLRLRMQKLGISRPLA